MDIDQIGKLMLLIAPIIGAFFGLMTGWNWMRHRKKGGN